MTLTDRLREKLIELFARHSTDEIKENSGELLKEAIGINNYPDIQKIRGYNDFYEKLKKLRKELEFAVDNDEGIQQVKGCLDLLLQKKDPEREEADEKDFELSAKLIRKGIYHLEWNKEQQKYFDLGCEMFTVWKDYFLSYTNRNRHETNSDFMHIIPPVLGESFYREKKDESNLVPHLLVHYLHQHGIRGFFDKHNMTCGDVIKDEIFKYCTSAYAFVQLVEIEIFNHREGEKNWCHNEFNTFDQWIKDTKLDRYKRYQFLLTHKKEEVFPVDLHKDYKDWKNKIEERLYIDNLIELDRKKIREKMRELAMAIRDTREQILTDYCK